MIKRKYHRKGPKPRGLARSVVRLCKARRSPGTSSGLFLPLRIQITTECGEAALPDDPPSISGNCGELRAIPFSRLDFRVAFLSNGKDLMVFFS
jgi:hypothetical protein